jgi:DUF1009 family protein
MKLGLIAETDNFRFWLLEGARKAGVQVAVAAIREETDPQIEKIADNISWLAWVSSEDAALF